MTQCKSIVYSVYSGLHLPRSEVAFFSPSQFLGWTHCPRKSGILSKEFVAVFLMYLTMLYANGRSIKKFSCILRAPLRAAPIAETNRRTTRCNTC